MNNKDHLLFLTTSALATNPRLVKEFEFLKQFNKCTVFSFSHNDWSLEASHAIMNKNKDVKFISINRHKNVFGTLRSKLYHKIAIILNPFFKSNTRIAAYASNDKTAQLLFKAKRYTTKHKLDRVIAHNMGSFYPAMRIANSSNAKLQLDIEDYHPGEELYFNKKYDLQNRHLVMQKAITISNTITYASEGIKQKCESVFKIRPLTKQSVIINAFKHGEFKKPEHGNEELNMVWFSQNISANRGLEAVFDLAKQHPEIKIHLIGKANNSFIESMKPSENVIIYKPMLQQDLHNFLVTMDIGLALENKNADRNRDICLTNKFLAYAQAGLFIIASDTFGQSHFLNQLGSYFGVIIKNSLDETFQNLDTKLLDNKIKIERWELAKDFSWEKQSELLLQVME